MGTGQRGPAHQYTARYITWAKAKGASPPICTLRGVCYVLRDKQDIENCIKRTKKKKLDNLEKKRVNYNFRKQVKSSLRRDERSS